MSDFSQTTTIDASRKRHQCSECLQPIEKGKPYDKSCGVFWGDWFIWKAHVDCTRAANHVIAEVGSIYFDDGWGGLERQMDGMGETELFGLIDSYPDVVKRLRLTASG